MATSKTFSNSLDSDQVIDFPCTRCAKNNRMEEAVHFCVQCQEYLCSKCTECHNSFSLMAGHVLQNAVIASKKNKNFTDISAARCPKHQEETIKMYCVTHDQVICIICSRIDHKFCNDIQYIPNITHGLDSKQTSTDTTAALIKALDQMVTLKDALNKCIYKLNITKETTLNAIQTFREKLNKKLDELEKNTKQQIEHQNQTQQIKLQALNDQVTAIANNLQKLLDQVENTEQNSSEQFIFTKLSKESISMAATMSSQLLPPSIQVTFSPSLALENCLEQLLSLGDIIKVNLDLYTVKNALKYNIKIPSDAKTCDINATFILDSGDILLADWRNKKLKLFNTNTNAVTSDCSLPDKPHEVCTVTDKEAAVSLFNKTIQFVSIGDELIPTRLLQMDHGCFGIGIVGDYLYITEYRGTNLYVHALNGGELCRTINMDQSGQQIFSDTRRLTIGHRVHVIDSNSLITLDTQGQVVWKYSGSDQSEPRYVCTDGFGNVLVCNRTSNHVIQLGPTGQSLGVLVNESHGLKLPESVCFDKKHSRLFVTNYNNDNLLVFTIE